ncbi:hypothetical protein GCM10010415_68820 [Streptomyces atrovirens]
MTLTAVSGPALLTTVFGTADRDEAEMRIPGLLAEGTAQQTEFAQTQQLPDPWGHEVLTEDISTAFVPAAAMPVLPLATAWFVIRVRKSGLKALSGSAGPGMGREGNITDPARRLAGRCLRTRRAKARPARPHQGEQNPEQRLHDQHHGSSPAPARRTHPHVSGPMPHTADVSTTDDRSRRVPDAHGEF